MPVDEFRLGPSKPLRTPPHERLEEEPTLAPQHELQRRDNNDLEALIEVVSQLTAQSRSMTERLIEAERLKSESQQDAAIAQAEVKAIEDRLVLVHEQHLAELKVVHERMATESEQMGKTIEEAAERERELQVRLSAAENDLATMRARSWWRRLVG